MLFKSVLMGLAVSASAGSISNRGGDVSNYHYCYYYVKQLI